MAELTFYLSNPEKPKSSLKLYIRWGNSTVKFSPGISVVVDDWDQKEQKIINKYDPFADDINFNLNKTKVDIEYLFTQLKYEFKRLPTKRELEKVLIKQKNPDAEPDESFFHFWENHIALLTAELKAAGKDLNRNSTASAYQQTLKMLREMVGNRKQGMVFNDVNDDFYTQLLTHCTKVLKLKPNSIGKHVKNVKAVMEKARKKGLHTNIAYKEFRMLEEEVHTIALTREELDRMYKLDLSGKNGHLATSRDLFIIAASTGLRFGDWSQLMDKDLSGKTVTIITEKTKATVVIPLSDRVKRILKRYDGNPPKPKQNQPLNRDLKEIAKLAGIVGTETFSSTKGGKTKINTCQRWELVTTHTARRSFATNLYLVFPHPYEIMKITGHKTEAKFLKYIKISKDDAALKMLEFID